MDVRHERHGQMLLADALSQTECRAVTSDVTALERTMYRTTLHSIRRLKWLT